MGFWQFATGGGSGGGTGDVVGPASSTDNAIARFDGATGKLLQNSDLLISEPGIVANYTSVLQFGGSTSSFPGFSRVSTSGTEIRVVLADLSAFTTLRAGTLNVSASGTGNTWSENLLNVGTAGTWGTSGLYVPLAAVLNWSATPSGGGGDTGLARSAAGVVKVTDGGAGLGKIYVDGSTTSVRLGSRAYIGASGVDRVDIYDSAGATGSANIFSTIYGSHGGHFNLNPSYLAFKRNAGMQWSDSTSTWSANLVASLYSPASNTVSIGSGANGTGWATNVKVATSTVNAAGATSAASNLVPAGCILLGVTTRVTTAITSGDGGTSVDIGNGTDVDMYGDNIAFALGTTTDLASHTASALAWKSAAESVVFTCVGGTFNGGVWRVCAHYLDLTAPTS